MTDDNIIPKDERNLIKPIAPIDPVKKYDSQEKRIKTLKELDQEEELKQKALDEQNKKEGRGSFLNKRF